MKNVRVKVVFDRRKNATETTEGYVELELSQSGKRKYVSLGLKARKNEWN